MAANLVLLSFKASVQRDGTNFQGDYWRDGQWIRFQRGIIKKMGGMRAINGFDINPDINISNTFLVRGTNNYIAVYLCSYQNIRKLTIDNNFNLIADQGNKIAVDLTNPETIWQSQVIINNNNKQVLFMGTNNATNIAENSAPIFYTTTIESNDNFTSLDLNTQGINTGSNGGMCYVNPYLFLYGSVGLVQYSRSNDPLSFTGGDSGAIKISNDKVIYGRPIRGGTNSPSVLFWTISSVIRIVNIGAEAVQFKVDTISNSSSILSSKCVVEYDGLFFWPGTDRFFVYNGIVQEINNLINLNYFFDNVDMNKRQLVFGLKNTKYGEIWWFYPEKVNAGNANIGCTRAVIYNKRENSWYDTAIIRSSGMFFEDLGIMCTTGNALAEDDTYKYVWRHEYGITQDWQPHGTEARRDNPITSMFTTPIFSWVAFNPTKSNPEKGNLVDRWIELRRIEPDFKMDNNDDEIEVSANIQTYAHSSSNTIVIGTFNNQTEKMDTHVQGRNMSLTFSSSGNFELGNTLLLVGIGDGQ